MKNHKGTFLKHILSVLIVMCMMLSVCGIMVNAASANQAVTNARNGVVQIQVWFKDPETAVEQYLHYGTGFLINENTVVTCEHVATAFPDSWYVEWAQETNAALGGNRTAAEVKEHLELRVSIYRDVYVKATVKKTSSEMDYAILTLNESVKNRAPLSIRNSSELVQTEEVYALGFPGDIVEIESVNSYDTDDVTITRGNVNKVGNMTIPLSDGTTYDNVNCVESSALITGGNSGGPLVDAEGNVVGINAASSLQRNIAISSQQLIAVLDALGIQYTQKGASPASEPVDEPEKQDVDTSELAALIEQAERTNAQDYTSSSYKALKDAISSAKQAASADSQDTVDAAVSELKKALDGLEEAEDEKAKEDKPEMNYVLFIVIGVGVLLLAAIIIVLVVLLRKKKNKTDAVPQDVSAPSVFSGAPQAPAQAPVAAPVSYQPSMPAQEAMSSSISETTVLDSGAGETTVLSRTVNGGTLVRLSNNEQIMINCDDFSIGRHRRAVNYCISGDTSISRVHARFVVRNGETYIVDNKSSNGTYVNDIKARPGEEVELKDGDVITLAEVKFKFKKANNNSQQI